MCANKKEEPYSYEELMRFLTGVGKREKDIAIGEELIADYRRAADAFYDIRFDRLSPQARTLAEAVRILSTSHYQRRSPSRRLKINTPAAAGSFFMDWFKGFDHEELAALYLDKRKHSIGCFTEARGDRYSVNINVQAVIRRAKVLDASYVILAHNHPHMPLLPSRADLDSTTVAAWSARSSGIELLDHIVVYATDFVSLYESGLISKDSTLADAKFSYEDGKLGKMYGNKKT